MTFARKACAWLICLVSVSCGGNAQSPTAPTETTFTTRYFSGVVEVGGARFYSFTVAVAGPVTANLASITAADSGLPIAIPLRLGLGVPEGTGCPASASVTVTAALLSQLDSTALPGVHCIEVADLGDVRAPVRFALRFTHP